MTVVIIEGPDCSGKTTLMRRAYRQEDGWQQIHCGPPSSSGAFFDYATGIKNIWNNRSNDHNVVFDRFLYGELIYGPMLRPKTQYNFTWAHVRMLERVLLSLQAVVIAAATDWETTKQLWLERQETELLPDVTKLQTTYDQYDLLFKHPPAIPVVEYDFQKMDFLEVVQAARTLATPLNKGPGIGYFRKDVTLLVGEQINMNTMLHRDWPFVASGESSLWLAEQLEVAGISERNLYWVNAITDAGEDLDPKFIEDLQPRRVIALGKAAEIWMTRTMGKNTAELIAVPHPQFWRRFHGAEPYPLIEALA